MGAKAKAIYYAILVIVMMLAGANGIVGILFFVLLELIYIGEQIRDTREIMERKEYEAKYGKAE